MEFLLIRLLAVGLCLNVMYYIIKGAYYGIKQDFDRLKDLRKEKV